MKKPRGRANSIDVHVGGRVRMRRTLLGLNQTTLGEALGISFQQVQKNERGTNRIGASRLYEISKILDVPVSYFFEELTEESAAVTPIALSPVNIVEERRREPMQKRETLELVRAYYKITEPNVRKHLFELVKAVGRSKD
ncbi:MAG: helix-turn-helix transcriptional regulator [Proteobacteria bacterium]|nr:helix-turn-helix transcriptional regulator [Pseudomonadota bacterium]